MKKLVLLIFCSFICSLNCLATELSDPEEEYYIRVLQWIDGNDIPDNVKQFAKQNNCIYVMKNYYWSDKKYRGGEVYTCGINHKLQFILVNGEKMRFANFIQKKKLNKVVYDN